MPPALLILAEIALVLYILFGYLLNPSPSPEPPYRRQIITVLVIIVVLVFWFLLPVHIGNG